MHCGPPNQNFEWAIGPRCSAPPMTSRDRQRNACVYMLMLLPNIAFAGTGMYIRIRVQVYVLNYLIFLVHTASDVIHCHHFIFYVVWRRLYFSVYASLGILWVLYYVQYLKVLFLFLFFTGNFIIDRHIGQWSFTGAPLQYSYVYVRPNTTMWLQLIASFLPARRCASAGNSDRNVSVCPPVRPSVCHAPVLCQNEES